MCLGGAGWDDACVSVGVGVGVGVLVTHVHCQHVGPPSLCHVGPLPCAMWAPILCHAGALKSCTCEPQSGAQEEAEARASGTG